MPENMPNPPVFSPGPRPMDALAMHLRGGSATQEDALTAHFRNNRPRKTDEELAAEAEQELAADAAKTAAYNEADRAAQADRRVATQAAQARDAAWRAANPVTLGESFRTGAATAVRNIADIPANILQAGELSAKLAAQQAFGANVTTESKVGNVASLWRKPVAEMQAELAGRHQSPLNTMVEMGAQVAGELAAGGAMTSAARAATLRAAGAAAGEQAVARATQAAAAAGRTLTAGEAAQIARTATLRESAVRDLARASMVERGAAASPLAGQLEKLFPLGTRQEVFMMGAPSTEGAVQDMLQQTGSPVAALGSFVTNTLINALGGPMGVNAFLRSTTPAEVMASRELVGKYVTDAATNAGFQVGTGLAQSLSDKLIRYAATGEQPDFSVDEAALLTITGGTMGAAPHLLGLPGALKHNEAMQHINKTQLEQQKLRDAEAAAKAEQARQAAEADAAVAQNHIVQGEQAAAQEQAALREQNIAQAKAQAEASRQELARLPESQRDREARWQEATRAMSDRQAQDLAAARQLQAETSGESPDALAARRRIDELNLKIGRPIQHYPPYDTHPGETPELQAAKRREEEDREARWQEAVRAMSDRLAQDVAAARQLQAETSGESPDALAARRRIDELNRLIGRPIQHYPPYDTHPGETPELPESQRDREARWQEATRAMSDRLAQDVAAARQLQEEFSGESPAALAARRRIDELNQQIRRPIQHYPPYDTHPGETPELQAAKRREEEAARLPSGDDAAAAAVYEARQREAQAAEEVKARLLRSSLAAGTTREGVTGWLSANQKKRTVLADKIQAATVAKSPRLPKLQAEMQQLKAEESRFRKLLDIHDRAESLAKEKAPYDPYAGISEGARAGLERQTQLDSAKQERTRLEQEAQARRKAEQDRRAASEASARQAMAEELRQAHRDHAEAEAQRKADQESAASLVKDAEDRAANASARAERYARNMRDSAKQEHIRLEQEAQARRKAEQDRRAESEASAQRAMAEELQKAHRDRAEAETRRKAEQESAASLVKDAEDRAANASARAERYARNMRESAVEREAALRRDLTETQEMGAITDTKLPEMEAETQRSSPAEEALNPEQFKARQRMYAEADNADATAAKLEEAGQMGLAKDYRDFAETLRARAEKIGVREAETRQAETPQDPDRLKKQQRMLHDAEAKTKEAGKARTEKTPESEARAAALEREAADLRKQAEGMDTRQRKDLFEEDTSPEARRAHALLMKDSPEEATILDRLGVKVRVVKDPGPESVNRESWLASHLRSDEEALRFAFRDALGIDIKPGRDAAASMRQKLARMKPVDFANLYQKAGGVRAAIVPSAQGHAPVINLVRGAFSDRTLAHETGHARFLAAEQYREGRDAIRRYIESKTGKEEAARYFNADGTLTENLRAELHEMLVQYHSEEAANYNREVQKRLLGAVARRSLAARFLKWVAGFFSRKTPEEMPAGELSGFEALRDINDALDKAEENIQKSGWGAGRNTLYAVGKKSEDRAEMKPFPKGEREHPESLRSRMREAADTTGTPTYTNEEARSGGKELADEIVRLKPAESMDRAQDFIQKVLEGRLTHEEILASRAIASYYAAQCKKTKTLETFALLNHWSKAEKMANSSTAGILRTARRDIGSVDPESDRRSVDDVLLGTKAAAAAAIHRAAELRGAAKSSFLKKQSQLLESMDQGVRQTLRRSFGIDIKDRAQANALSALMKKNTAVFYDVEQLARRAVSDAMREELSFRDRARMFWDNNSVAGMLMAFRRGVLFDPTSVINQLWAAATMGVGAAVRMAIMRSPHTREALRYTLAHLSEDLSGHIDEMFHSGPAVRERLHGEQERWDTNAVEGAAPEQVNLDIISPKLHAANRLTLGAGVTSIQGGDIALWAFVYRFKQWETAAGYKAASGSSLPVESLLALDQVKDQAAKAADTVTMRGRIAPQRGHGAGDEARKARPGMLPGEHAIDTTIDKAAGVLEAINAARAYEHRDANGVMRSNPFGVAANFVFPVFKAPAKAAIFGVESLRLIRNARDFIKRNTEPTPAEVDAYAVEKRLSTTEAKNWLRQMRREAGNVAIARTIAGPVVGGAMAALFLPALQGTPDDEQTLKTSPVSLSTLQKMDPAALSVLMGGFLNSTMNLYRNHTLDAAHSYKVANSHFLQYFQQLTGQNPMVKAIDPEEGDYRDTPERLKDTVIKMFDPREGSWFRTVRKATEGTEQTGSAGHRTPAVSHLTGEERQRNAANMLFGGRAPMTDEEKRMVRVLADHNRRVEEYNAALDAKEDRVTKRLPLVNLAPPKVTALKYPNGQPFVMNAEQYRAYLRAYGDMLRKYMPREAGDPRLTGAWLTEARQMAKQAGAQAVGAVYTPEAE